MPSFGGVAGDVLERLDEAGQGRIAQTLGQPNVLRKPDQLIIELVAQQQEEVPARVRQLAVSSSSSLSAAWFLTAAPLLFDDSSRASSPPTPPDTSCHQCVCRVDRRVHSL